MNALLKRTQEKCLAIGTGITLYLFLFPLLAAAQEPDGQGPLFLELNKAEVTGPNCRYSFVLNNGTGESVESASYELVLFSVEGVIDQMSVFDFGALPAGKTVVRQFELPGSCDKAGKFLINGPSGCSNGTPARHCTASLVLSSRTSHDLLQ